MKGEDGFSLIEVLVAFMMTSLALAVLYGALTDNARQIYEAELREVTTGHALSHMAAIGTSLPAATADGLYPNGTSWRLEVVPLPAKPAGREISRPQVIALRILLSVFDRRQRQLLQLKSYRLQAPEPAGEVQ